MIEFMVIALPRSGTTWAANWLTTDTTICLHDPLYANYYKDLDKIKSSKKIGISCTGIFKFGDWLNNHPARKVILHRDTQEINDSLSELGLGMVTKSDEESLLKINGKHCQWSEIFDNPRWIYEYLLDKEFDQERHAELKSIQMQPDFGNIKINKDNIKKLIEEMRVT